MGEVITSEELKRMRAFLQFLRLKWGAEQGPGDTLRPALGSVRPLPQTMVVFPVGILTGFLAGHTSFQKLFFSQSVNL